MALSHRFWCRVSRARLNLSMFLTPGSSVMLYSRAVCSRPWASAAALARKSASRLPLATMNRPFHG
jgi:hypothetical protein